MDKETEQKLQAITDTYNQHKDAVRCLSSILLVFPWPLNPATSINFIPRISRHRKLTPFMQVVKKLLDRVVLVKPELHRNIKKVEA